MYKELFQNQLTYVIYSKVVLILISVSIVCVSFKGAGTSSMQIFIIIEYWLLGIFLVFVEPQLMVDPKEYC